MKITIQKRYSTDTLLEGEAESLKEFVIKSRSNLSGSNLSRSNLSGSDLSHSNLSHSNLSGSDLSRSDLSHSDLSHSNLSHSNLRWCKIKASQKDELLKALKIEIID